MLVYLLSKLAAMVIYPLNQAGGWGSFEMIADPKTKTLYIDSQEYGCSYNAPYLEGNYQLYYQFLKSKGWKIIFDSPQNKWEIIDNGGIYC